jgi:hypothetical protein
MARWVRQDGIGYRRANGGAALHYASSNGRIDVGKRLIDQGAQLDLLHGDGRTALHLAAAAMSKEVLELLTRRGASVVIRDKNGMRYMEVWKQKKRRRGEGRIQGSTQGHQAPLKAWGYHIGAMS